jgi:hypothetical protein
VIGTTCMLLCGSFALPFAQQTAGASWHPAFPVPSWLRGQSDEAKLGRIAPREREGVSATTPSLSSSALCALAHWGGRSSIPEAVVMEPRGRGVLDSPPSRGMTVSSGEPAHTSYSVIPTLGVIARLDRAIQYSETVVVQPRSCSVLDSPPQCASAHKAGNDSGTWRTMLLPHTPSLRGALATKQSRLSPRAHFWIASRSLSSGHASRGPVGSQ